MEAEGGLRGSKNGIEDTALELCLVCCAACTPQVHFPLEPIEERLDDIDARSGLEFSLARIKGFIGALL